jgi:outer membrane protein assembly factor BamB
MIVPVTGDLALRDSTESSQPAVSADPRLANLRTVDLLRTPFTVLALLSAGVAQDRKPDPIDSAAETPATENPDTAHDWRAFRGTGGRATSVQRVPMKWGDDENIEWKCKLAGPGTSSPIVVGGAVFVTHWSGYGLDPKVPGEISNLRRHLLRIERATGKIVWKKTVMPAKTEDPIGGRMRHGYASSTPVSDGKHVYVFFGKVGVLAFDLDGEEVWRTNVGTNSSKWLTGSGSSPTLWRDLVFVNAADESASLWALNKKSGAEVWARSAAAFDQAYGTPILGGEGDDAELLFGMLGELWGLDPRTGKTRWRVETKTNGALAPSIIVGRDTMYSFGGQTGKRSYAVRLGGLGDVTKTHVRWASRYGSYVTTPLLHDDHLYWVNEGGILFCADAATGKLVFKDRLNGTFYSSPVRAGGAIYFVSRGEGTYVIAAKPEFELLHHNRIESDESDFDATPAISGGRVFLRSRDWLYCISNR